jgi:hypothetical protein
MTDDAASAGALLRYIVKFKDGVKEPPAAQLYYRDTEAGRAQAEAFARAHDEQGFSIYSCIGKLRGAPRNKANVAELDSPVLDLDLRNIVESREQAIACLRNLPLPPEIRDSGRGLHAIWRLKEPLIDEAGLTEAETTMRRLVALLAGDPKPTHRAALLRHLGTHNSRDNEWRECQVLEHGKPCDISEFADMFDLYGDTALLHYKEGAAAPFNGEGKRLPIDLEAMRYQGNPGMNDTFMGYLGSRLSYGETVEEIINKIVEVAERNCRDDPNRDKWRHDLAAKATWWLENHPEWLESALQGDVYTIWTQKIEEGLKPQLTFNQLHGLHVRGYRKKDDNTKPDDNAKPTEQKSKVTWPTPYSRRDASQIPLRKFILGQHYLLGAVTITVAGGGVGKSTLTLLEAISFAIGRDLLLGEPLQTRRRVWVWNAEDDVDEMERRVIGICTHYNINRTELDGWLFLDSGYDLPLDLASGQSGRTVLQTGLLDTIAARVGELKIEVVGLDPLVALHTMPEGDNPGHAKLLRTLNNKIAKPCGCAIDINHHPRKTAPGQDNGITADDVRGASSIVHSARSGRLLHQMTLAEAEKFGIESDDRFTYFRMERAKANMARRGTICWVHLIEVPISNAAGGAYGDIVTVPTVWTPPDTMAGVSDITIAAIRSEMGKGEYRRDARAGGAWAGRLIALRLGLDLGTRAGKNRAIAILNMLIRKGVLTVEIRHDQNRNAREYVVPGAIPGGNM